MAIKIKMTPSHPGAVIKALVMPGDVSVTQAAKMLNVSRQTLDALINERRSLTPEMALKVEAVFGGDAKTLLDIQGRYDLHHARENAAAITRGLKPYKARPAVI